MIADQPAEIKIVNSNPFQNASMPNERISSISSQVAAQFSFSTSLKSKTTEQIFTIFTQSRAISGAINACIRKTILHFVYKTRAKSEDSQFFRWQKSPKINWLP